MAASGFQEADLRYQTNDLLWAGIATEPALYAARFIELELRHVWVVLHGPRWTGANTGQAECAALHIHLDGTEGCAVGKRQDIHGAGCRRMQSL